MEARVKEPEVDGAAPRRGNSIWSMLVIMTLLAVWLAVPRHSALFAAQSNSGAFYWMAHQLLLWMALAVTIWLLLGKRRILMYAFATVFGVAWTPLAICLLEGTISATEVSERLNALSRLYE